MTWTRIGQKRSGGALTHGGRALVAGRLLPEDGLGPGLLLGLGGLGEFGELGPGQALLLEELLLLASQVLLLDQLPPRLLLLLLPLVLVRLPPGETLSHRKLQSTLSYGYY